MKYYVGFIIRIFNFILNSTGSNIIIIILQGYFDLNWFAVFDTIYDEYAVILRILAYL